MLSSLQPIRIARINLIYNFKNIEELNNQPSLIIAVHRLAISLHRDTSVAVPTC